MKRLGLAGVLVAVLASGCATAFVGEPTYVSDTGATANGFIWSTSGGSTSLFSQDLDGSNVFNMTSGSPEGEADPAWSPRP